MTDPVRWWSNPKGWALIAAGVAALAASAAADDISPKVRKSRQDLLESSITAPKAPPSASTDLRRAMEHVQGMRIPPKRGPTPAAPASVPEAAPQVGPTGTLLDGTPPAAPAQPRTPEISDAVVEELKQLPAERITNLLELADALYLGGREPEAFLFYEKALNGQMEADAKAWALFQMANCRRWTDSSAAVALYKRLATEYPKSPWTRIAEVEVRLVEWYQKTGPQAAGGAGTKVNQP